jgi:hypothetical protein
MPVDEVVGMVEINEEPQGADVVRLADPLDRGDQGILVHDFNQTTWQPDQVRGGWRWRDSESGISMILEVSLPGEGKRRLIRFSVVPFIVMPADLQNDVGAPSNDVIDALLLARERCLSSLVSVND